MEKVRKCFNCVAYWHERMLLATEITLGQPWDIVFLHFLLALLFVLFWYFNYRLVNFFSLVTPSPSSFAKEEL